MDYFGVLVLIVFVIGLYLIYIQEV